MQQYLRAELRLLLRTKKPSMVLLFFRDYLLNQINLHGIFLNGIFLRALWIFWAYLPERALIDLTATASAVSFTHYPLHRLKLAHKCRRVGARAPI